MDKTQHLITSKNNSVEILHWENNKYGKFELLQSLFTGGLFFVKKWDDHYYLATANLKNVTIYKYDTQNVQLLIFSISTNVFCFRYSNKLKRFVKVQTIPQLDRVIEIKLDAVDKNCFILSMLKEKQEHDLLVSVYVYKGLAGFQVSFEESLNYYRLINMMTVIQKNFFVIAFAVYDHIKIMKVIFIGWIIL